MADSESKSTITNIISASGNLFTRENDTISTQGNGRINTLAIQHTACMASLSLFVTVFKRFVHRGLRALFRIVVSLSMRRDAHMVKVKFHRALAFTITSAVTR